MKPRTISPVCRRRESGVGVDRRAATRGGATIRARRAGHDPEDTSERAHEAMKPYRKQKVASLIQTIVSETITYDLHDPRVVSLTTVTRVEMSPDLLQAKVYLSVMGSDADERTTLAGVQSAGGFIQRRVAGAVQLRHCPHLTFMIDEGAKIARDTLRILDENRRLRGETDDPDDPSVSSADPSSLGSEPEPLAGEEASG